MTIPLPMTARRRHRSKGAIFRDRLLDALRLHGYQRIKRRQVVMAGCLEFTSPPPCVGEPLIGARHSLHVDKNGRIYLLRANAGRVYALPLPKRVVDLLLGRSRRPHEPVGNPEAPE